MPPDRTKITVTDIKAEGIPDDYVITASGGNSVWAPPTGSGGGGTSTVSSKLVWVGV